MDLREDTIFTLHARPEARVATRSDWFWLGLLVALGWMGAVSLIGRYRASQVTRALSAFFPPDTRGMLWVIVAHAMVDVGLMSAFFVPQ